MVVALPSLLGLIIFSAALADPLIATKYIKLHRLVIFHMYTIDPTCQPPSVLEAAGQNDLQTAEIRNDYIIFIHFVIIY